MNSIPVFARVVWALINREALTRNGRWRFGYIWAFAEPAFYIIGFVAVRGFISSRTPFGESAILFLITALLTFRTAIGLTRRTMGAIQSNIALLTFPQVKTFDVIVARIGLETMTWIGVSLIFVVGLYLFTGIWAPQNLPTMLEGYLATIFLGSSFGFFNATFVRIAPFWDRALALLSLPLFLASGIFFLPSSLPPDVMSILWWNPFLHVVEWVRSGVYIDYSPYLSKNYVLTLSCGLMFAGLFINKFFQAQMLRE